MLFPIDEHEARVTRVREHIADDDRGVRFRVKDYRLEGSDRYSIKTAFDPTDIMNGAIVRPLTKETTS